MPSSRVSTSGFRGPRYIVALALLALTLVGCTAQPPPSALPAEVPAETLDAINLGAGWTWETQATRLELGVTHTQNSLDLGAPAEARDRGRDILRGASAVWQNHHLMGFGTLNPEPSPGQYDWASLDRRMRLTRDTGGRTVLTVCCTPDWMKGGAVGETDWSRLERAPFPENFDDFARLSAAAVQRYPQIERVLVWNELKGFFDNGQNRWNAESYTDLYNRVYTAVKAVRPDVQVGGPYVVLSSLEPRSPDASDTVTGPWGAADQRALDVVEYWIDNNVGAEFLVVDGGTGTRAGTVPPRLEDGTQKFADLTAWIRERSPLAIWWAEFYANVPPGEEAGAATPASAVSTLAAVAAFASSGTSVALLWGPQGHSLEYSALWTDSTESDGGLPTPLTAAWQWLVPRLAGGDVEIGRSSTLPLLAFRAQDGMLIVNLRGEPVTVAPDREPLPAWAVTLRARES